MALKIGITPLIIGLTVVSMGTSSPELAISINAGLSGQGNVALGNVIGSNIANVLLILGLVAMISPIVVQSQLIRLDVPLLIGVSVGVLLLGLDGNYGRFDGILLVTALVIYLVFLIRQGKSGNVDSVGETAVADKSSAWLKNGLFVLLGLGLLVVGARWLVETAVTFAQLLGISELIISLTIIAVGTSLPEIVTSLLAALKGESDLAIGNAVGSNLFNLLGVLGVTSMVAPGGIPVTPAVIGFDLPIMLAVAFACLPIFFTGGQISRSEGVFLFGYYVAYTLYLILAAAQHDALPRFSLIMVTFVLPITAVTLGILTFRDLRGRYARRYIQDRKG